MLGAPAKGMNRLLVDHGKVMAGHGSAGMHVFGACEPLRWKHHMGHHNQNQQWVRSPPQELRKCATSSRTTSNSDGDERSEDCPQTEGTCRKQAQLWAFNYPHSSPVTCRVNSLGRCIAVKTRTSLGGVPALELIGTNLGTFCMLPGE